MDRTYVSENDESRKRLCSLVESLSDEDLALPMGQHWTIGVGLMHLAFWDRQWTSKFKEWEGTGEVVIPAVATERALFDALNDGMLAWWRTITPAYIRTEVISAAEAVDEAASKLDERLVEAILAQRPRTVIRAVHRADHLTEIDSILAGKA
jgi:uncharacterized damage-inducible protein DinB